MPVINLASLEVLRRRLAFLLGQLLYFARSTRRAQPLLEALE